jgi:UrcA family protein
MTTANLPQSPGRRTTVRIAALVGYFVAATATGVASATSPADDVPSVVVRYADLDLATDHGVRVLYARIAQAASAVCPEVPESNLHALALSRACQQQAIARAVRAVNSPLLAEVDADHRKHS